MFLSLNYSSLSITSITINTFIHHPLALVITYTIDTFFLALFSVDSEIYLPPLPLQLPEVHLLPSITYHHYYFGRQPTQTHCHNISLYPMFLFPSNSSSSGQGHSVFLPRRQHVKTHNAAYNNNKSSPLDSIVRVFLWQWRWRRRMLGAEAKWWLAAMVVVTNDGAVTGEDWSKNTSAPLSFFVYCSYNFGVGFDCLKLVMPIVTYSEVTGEEGKLLKGWGVRRKQEEEISVWKKKLAAWN